MPVYNVGDVVIHSEYGSGKIVAVDDKGPPGAPFFYYVIETGEQTLWVPVEEHGSSSLHQTASGADFTELITLFRSPAEKLSNNPYQRRDQLAERMKKASPRDFCLVIRDLNDRSHSRRLSTSDIQVLNQAQASLLDEWQRSLGTSPEKARSELAWILSEKPQAQTLF